MVISNTENVYTDIFAEQGWDIRPFNVTQVVEAKTVDINIRSVIEEEVLPGRIQIGISSGVLEVEKEVHYRLLQKSLVEYKGVWRTLSEK